MHILKLDLGMHFITDRKWDEQKYDKKEEKYFFLSLPAYLCSVSCKLCVCVCVCVLVRYFSFSFFPLLSLSLSLSLSSFALSSSHCSSRSPGRNSTDTHSLSLSFSFYFSLMFPGLSTRVSRADRSTDCCSCARASSAQGSSRLTRYSD